MKLSMFKITTKGYKARANVVQTIKDRLQLQYDHRTANKKLINLAPCPGVTIVIR